MGRAARSAVIVDGYSAGALLPGAFGRLGVAAVHLQSTPELIPGLVAPSLDAYQVNVIHTAAHDLDATAAALAPYRPVAVVTGAESGVALADALSERLGLATNGSRLSSARRDKYQMIERLRAAGIRTADQFTSANPAKLMAWADRCGYPVVVKPLSSSSTDNVYICADHVAVANAVEAVLSSVDMFRQANTHALVQSYLDGTEYIVDTVSAAGRHYVCAVWEYEKTTVETGRRIYHNDVLCDPDADPIPELIGYTRTVLDALGIRHGAAHAEVIMTAAGPTLVEIGARPNGGVVPDFQNRCVGANQTDLTALAYVRPERFRHEFGGRVYGKRCAAITHRTATRRDGVVRSVDEQVLGQLAALPTVHTVLCKLAPGSRMRPTVDLPTSPLWIYLLDADPARLDADLKEIDDLKDLVYRLSPA